MSGGATLDELVESGLLSRPHLPSKKKATQWWERVEAALSGAGGSWTEPNVTGLLASADGAFQAAVVHFFCTATGTVYRESMRLISGEELVRHSTGSFSGRRIDLVIAEWDDDTDSWTPLAGIEAKFDASVNGGRTCGNPAHGGSNYSNQLICYPSGCTHPDLSLPKPFVWLSDIEATSLVGKRMGVTPAWQNDADKRVRLAWSDAWIAQELAKAVWIPATWADLRQFLEVELRRLGIEERFTESIIRGVTRTW